MKMIKFVLIALLALSVPACGSRPPSGSIIIEGLQEVPQENGQVESARVRIEELDQTPPPSPVEVLWEVPEARVEGFVIHYGYSPDNLDKEVILWSEDLEVALEGSRMVFRHLIEDTTPGKAVYVAVSAFDESGVSSEPSRILEVR